MYYSSGNYEAFARPKKPEGVDNKSAYIVGSGLAALTAACYLVRDGQMKGEHIHIFEKDPVSGGACDGRKYDIGYMMRGGREMDNHFEVMWDLLRSIPSIETEGASVLDEYYWLNKKDPNYSLCRATKNRGEDAHTDGKFDISTDMPFEISENRQDYSFVRIYDPSDPDNFIAELRPDYDNGVFANRVLDTTEGTVYLIKVRTMRAVKGYTLSMTVRDPIAGEIPELPIEIPFDGKKGTFAFDRMVNYPADAIWYGITLPEGVFSMAGRSGGAFEMKMYAPGDLDTPVAEAAQIGIDYDEVNQMYIYVWGIADLEITVPGRYLMHVTDNSVPFEVELSMLAEDGISTVGTDPADDVWYNLQGMRLDGRPSAPGIYIRNGRKTAVR